MLPNSECPCLPLATGEPVDFLLTFKGGSLDYLLDGCVLLGSRETTRKPPFEGSPIHVTAPTVRCSEDRPFHVLPRVLGRPGCANPYYNVFVAAGLPFLVFFGVSSMIGGAERPSREVQSNSLSPTSGLCQLGIRDSRHGDKIRLSANNKWGRSLNFSYLGLNVPEYLC